MFVRDYVLEQDKEREISLVRYIAFFQYNIDNIQYNSCNLQLNKIVQNNWPSFKTYFSLFKMLFHCLGAILFSISWFIKISHGLTLKETATDLEENCLSFRIKTMFSVSNKFDRKIIKPSFCMPFYKFWIKIWPLMIKIFSRHSVTRGSVKKRF